MTVPTEGETYAKMMHHLREVQDCCATLAHITRANDESVVANGWLHFSEYFKKVQQSVTKLAMKGLQ
jgi:hypothetical protein